MAACHLPPAGGPSGGDKGVQLAPTLNSLQFTMPTQQLETVQQEKVYDACLNHMSVRYIIHFVVHVCSVYNTCSHQVYYVYMYSMCLCGMSINMFMICMLALLCVQ